MQGTGTGSDVMLTLTIVVHLRSVGVHDCTYWPVPCLNSLVMLMRMRIETIDRGLHSTPAMHYWEASHSNIAVCHTPLWGRPWVRHTVLCNVPYLTKEVRKQLNEPGDLPCNGAKLILIKWFALQSWTERNDWFQIASNIAYNDPVLGLCQAMWCPVSDKRITGTNWINRERY